MGIEQDWESIAFLRRCNDHYRKALDMIERREFKITLKDEDCELDLDDILKEQEYQAIAEIIDSFIRAEVVRNDFGIYKIEQRIGGKNDGRGNNYKERVGCAEEHERVRQD